MSAHVFAQLRMENGWYVHNERVIFGHAQQNGWWRAGTRPNITRNALTEIAPNRTEDLDKLTDSMLKHAYPGFEHNYGLWYDRRRDAHDTQCRSDAKVEAPFLEQPWGRSGEGMACDGLSKYDLATFNPWYFERLQRFARHSDEKGTVLIHNFHLQHNLLENPAHYADFPWRPNNTIQDTGMPENIPAANIFYDLSDPTRHDLHRAYIRKVLSELSAYSNVIYLTAYEYTGSVEFMRFWIDTLLEWEKENDVDLNIGLGATKDVQDAILADPVRGPEISTIDLRYWWYETNGFFAAWWHGSAITLHAPPGGNEIPGRYVAGYAASKTIPQNIYRQVRETRDRFPDKGIIHSINASREQFWAFLMGGGSFLVQQLTYTPTDPSSYVAPDQTLRIQKTYDFINTHLAGLLQKTRPADLILNDTDQNWCLAYKNNLYLVYALNGGKIELDLSDASGEYSAHWFNPETGSLHDAIKGKITGGKLLKFNAPDTQDWVLYLVSVDHTG